MVITKQDVLPYVGTMVRVWFFDGQVVFSAKLLGVSDTGITVDASSGHMPSRYSDGYFPYASMSAFIPLSQIVATRQDASKFLGHNVKVTYYPPRPPSTGSQPTSAVTGKLDYADDVKIGLNTHSMTSEPAPAGGWPAPTYINFKDIQKVEDFSGTIATSDTTQASFLGFPVWGWLLAGVAVAVGLAMYRKYA